MYASMRPALRDLAPYAASDAGAAVNLSDNTNLWGPPPAAVSAMRALTGGALAAYPVISPTALYDQLAAYAGVTPDMIVAGCGSDDLIDCAMRAFAEPGDTIAFPTPTFSMVPAFASINQLLVHAVPYRADLDVDVDALLAPRPRLVYVCAPNNPTGSALPLRTIERIVSEAPGVVVLDEAYGEFTSAPGFALARRNERLVVTRTLSKAFGLAGLRIGYAVLAPSLARALETVRGPYKLNAAAVAAATAVFTDALPWVREQAGAAAANRARLADALATRGTPALPSDANFLCVPCRRARRLAARLLTHGVAVRVLTDLPAITPALAASEGTALRVTVGPWPLMERLLAAWNAEDGACA